MKIYFSGRESVGKTLGLVLKQANQQKRQTFKRSILLVSSIKTDQEKIKTQIINIRNKSGILLKTLQNQREKKYFEIPAYKIHNLIEMEQFLEKHQIFTQSKR